RAAKPARQWAAPDLRPAAVGARDGQRLSAFVAHLAAARGGDDELLVRPGHLVTPGGERDEQDEDDHPRHREEWRGRHETRHRTLLLLWSPWGPLPPRGWCRRLQPPSPRALRESRRRRWR